MSARQVNLSYFLLLGTLVGIPLGIAAHYIDQSTHFADPTTNTYFAALRLVAILIAISIIVRAFWDETHSFPRKHPYQFAYAIVIVTAWITLFVVFPS